MISRATWHKRVGAVVLFWLVASVVVALIHRQIPSAHWLLVHLLLLGAATNAILLWSDHFATSLLRLPDVPVKIRVARLVLLNLGVVGVIVGVVGQVPLAVMIGATLIVVAIVWNFGLMMVRKRKALMSRFFVSVYYYVVAGVLLIGVVTLGVFLSQGSGAVDHGQLILAHATGALLGWIGITILGTLITFWPTILRTRIDEEAQKAGNRALGFLGLGVVVTTAGFLIGVRPVVVLGLVGYCVGIVVLSGPFIRVMRNRPPVDFPALSVFAGVGWMLLGILYLAVIVVAGSSWEATAESAGNLSAVVVAGCVAQVLLGSLSFLLPSMVGGGPAAMRWRTRVVNRGAVTRVVVANGALIVCLLPVPSVVRVVASFVVLVALTWALPLLIRAIGTPSESAKEEAEKSAKGERADTNLRPARMGGSIVAGISIVILAIALGGAVDPAALGPAANAGASAGVAATGQTTVVDIGVKGMRFIPSRIEVPAGNKLIINLKNTGEDIHDLTLETGQATPRLKPGESATLDVGVVGRNIEGWCSVAGHRQMGMVLEIVATGPNANPQGDSGASQIASGQMDHSGMSGMNHGAGSGGDTASVTSDLDAQALASILNNPGPDFKARSAVLPPATKSKVHRVRLVVTETEQEVAPGIKQMRWTFGGTAPGPVLRGKIGDKFIVTLVNDGTIGHSIDFHAGALAPDKPMRTIAPGETLTYTFTAIRAGIWMYHCSTMPMSVHIANGMFGAVVIDPPDLPKVDREFVLVQSETYLGQPGGTADPAKVLAIKPSLVTFNGYPNQYDFQPLQVRARDRVRFWILDAGPNVASSFHVVGGQFDKVWFEGAYLLNGGPGGSQAMAMQPAQGGYVELTVPQAGNYPFVTHIMADAEKGAHGVMHAR